MPTEEYMKHMNDKLNECLKKAADIIIQFVNVVVAELYEEKFVEEDMPKIVPFLMSLEEYHANLEKGMLYWLRVKVAEEFDKEDIAFALEWFEKRYGKSVIDRGKRLITGEPGGDGIYG